MSQIVERLTIETSFTPPLVLDNPLEAGQPNFLLSLLKPRITVTAFGNNVVSEPYGAPDNYWPIVKLVAIGLAFFLLLFMVIKK